MAMYFRQRADHYAVGSYRHEPIATPQRELRRPGAALPPAVMPFTPEDFAVAEAEAVRVLPALAGRTRPADPARALNGMFSFTPDGSSIVGESAAVGGVWVCEAVWITHAGGMGRQVAEWMALGEPGYDLAEADANRFYPYQTTAPYVLERGKQQYREVYDILHPRQQPARPRDLRLTPFHPYHRALGASFVTGAGWERPQWFEANRPLLPGAPWEKRDGWAARLWSPIEGAEHLATRTDAALYDLTPFAKFEVSGPDAAAFLERVCANRVARALGAVVYTAMLTPRGGIRCDLTVTREGGARARPDRRRPRRVRHPPAGEGLPAVGPGHPRRVRPALRRDRLRGALGQGVPGQGGPGGGPRARRDPEAGADAAGRPGGGGARPGAGPRGRRGRRLRDLGRVRLLDRPLHRLRLPAGRARGRGHQGRDRVVRRAPAGHGRHRAAGGPEGRTAEGIARMPEDHEDGEEIVLAELGDDDLVKQMHDDLYDGLADEIVEGTTILLDRGWSAGAVLNKALVEGMRIVGIDFRDGILFVPEVLLAANAMKAGMAVLRPLLAETGAERMGKVVIGTVKGDIHDIGKNLVAMMLEGAGFDVVDLGINNPVENYLAALDQHKPDILGMSALLTTTMPYMKVVIDELVAKGIRDDYIVLVGGAPLNEEFGKAIGADAYCRDAAVAAETAQALVLSRRSASGAAEGGRA